MWDRDTDARAFREQLDYEVLDRARARAMTRDMRALRKREKQYERIVKEARTAGNSEELTTAKKLRDLCRQIINASQHRVSRTIDHEMKSDKKTRPRAALASYVYDWDKHVTKQRSTTVSDQVRDTAWPPVLDYPEIALLLPDLSRR